MITPKYDQLCELFLLTDKSTSTPCRLWTDLRIIAESLMILQHALEQGPKQRLAGFPVPMKLVSNLSGFIYDNYV